MENKHKLRIRILATRDAIPKSVADDKSRKVAERILALKAYQTAKTIFAYRAFGSELDLSVLTEQAAKQGKTVAYPVCDGRGHMLAAAVSDGNVWQTGRYGIREPALNFAKILAPSAIDLILVPGVAFTNDGCRLGYGGGYFDRFLPLCGHAVRLGVAFDEQMTDEMETCAHDCAMHAVVTDATCFVSASGLPLGELLL